MSDKIYAYKIRDLIDRLNIYRDAYYNNSESKISDFEYDILFDELKSLEDESGILFPDSPTQSVGFEVVSKLSKVEHAYPPMLSLDKTKKIEKLQEFIGDAAMFIMAKMDGLTCRITYNNGKLIRAETRGDGKIGEDITHNIKTVKYVPLTIPIEEEILVDGEIIIDRPTFEKIKNEALDSAGNPYKNPRNLASGSIRLLDSSKCATRGLKFIAWKVHGKSEDLDNNMVSRLLESADLGFRPVPHRLLSRKPTIEELESKIKYLRDYCDEKGFPIDGCVVSYMSMNKFDELGYTSHHSKAQMAFKFYDDVFVSTVRAIDWTLGKTGIITPTAIFDTIDIDGTEVSRASLHNLTIMKNLNIKIGSQCSVFKANMIIPQISSCSGGDSDIVIPDTCPMCGGRTSKKNSPDSDAVFLVCTNDDCFGKKLSLFKTFVGKSGFDIDGFGEKTLECFIEKGYLNKFEDIFKLSEHSEEIKELDGFEETSVSNLMTGIENAKTITLDKFLTALSIDNLGKVSAKDLADKFDNDIGALLKAVAEGFDFTEISGFGDVLNDSIHRYFRTHDISELLKILTITKLAKNVYPETPLTNKTFCITGTFPIPRSKLEAILISLGGILTSGVSKKLNILFAGDAAGSKLAKAQALGIDVYNLEKTKEFLAKYGYTY